MYHSTDWIKASKTQGLDRVLPVFRTRIHFIRIPIQHFRRKTDTDPDPGLWWFDDQKLNFLCYIKNYLLFTYPQTSIKDFQATEEAFSPQKWTSSTAKHEISYFFSIFVGHFCSLGSGLRIRKRSPDLIESVSNHDPDPKHWFLQQIIRYRT